MSNKVPSLEFIKIQTDSFAADLVKTIDQLRLDGRYSTEAVKESGIMKLINDRFKTSLTFIIIDTPVVDAACEIMPIKVDHPLNSVFHEKVGNDIGRLLANFGEKGHRLGTVNLDKCYVTGAFCNIPGTILVSRGAFTNAAMSSRSVAAFILHEIGHFITYLYYLVNTAMGLYVTTGIAANAMGASGDNERKVIFEKGARILGISGIDIDSMLTNTADQNAEILQALYIHETKDQLRSETGFGIYETKGSEQLADLIATKFGFGYDLAAGLSHIYRGNRATWSKGTLYASYAIGMVYRLALSIVTLGLSIPTTILQLQYNNTAELDPYDTPKDRIRLIRQHLIDELKYSSEMNRASINRVVEQIDAIAKHEKMLSNNPTLTTVLQRLISRRARSSKRVVDFQKTIEELLYNELFVKAQKFQSGAKK